MLLNSRFQFLDLGKSGGNQGTRRAAGSTHPGHGRLRAGAQPPEFCIQRGAIGCHSFQNSDLGAEPGRGQRRLRRTASLMRRRAEARS